MNYYKQGDAANADKIKAAFEKLGYEKGNVLHIGDYANERLFFFTVDGKIRSTLKDCGITNIIKTHPDYKELELPVEPKFKFKVGDWIVQNDNGTVSQITKTINGKDGYGEYLAYEHTNGYFAACFENEYHLWTIADAKDGDVLATGNIICIFKKLDKDGYYIISPCIYTVKYGLEVIDNEDDTIGSCGFKPATKEDRELLFRKMKEAGYTWDEKKKELRKIQPHYDISNFHAGMPVLVRLRDDHKWCYLLFSHCYKHQGILHFHAGGAGWLQCIPFNEETKHLLGTTDMCDERFINW